MEGLTGFGLSVDTQGRGPWAGPATAVAAMVVAAAPFTFLAAWLVRRLDGLRWQWAWVWAYRCSVLFVDRGR